MASTKERIIVVRNPVSSRANEVEHDVMSHLYDHFPTHQVTQLWTPSVDWDKTTDTIAEAIRPGDNIIVAAGDGTGSAAVNAYVRADAEGTKLGFLPYGNFNDMASTFTDRVAQENPLLLLQETTNQVKAYPLDILKDKEHVRYAMLYATLGWTALAASLFNQPEARQALQLGKANLTASLVDIARMYFQTRSSSILPEFYRNEERESHKTTTDVLAINGPIMARIIRSHIPFYTGGDFLSKDLDVSGFVKNIKFLGKSGINFALDTKLRLPGDRVSSDRLLFDNVSIPIQIDGEYIQLSHVDELAIVKSSTIPAITILKTTD